MELALIGLQNAGKTSLVNVLTTGEFHEDMIPTVGFNMRKLTKGRVTIKLWDLGGQVGPLVVAIQHKTGGSSCASLAVPPGAHAAQPLLLLRAQTRFRSMWERYCRGVQAIVFVVDSADLDGLAAARTELHALLAKPSLTGVALLVLANKNDLPEALSASEVIARLDLKASSSAAARRGEGVEGGAWRDITARGVSLSTLILSVRGALPPPPTQSIRDREVCVYSISCKRQSNIDVTLEWLTSHAK